MKNQPIKRTKRILPTFTTQAEEAEWWHKNRNVHGKELLAAVKSGEAQVLTPGKLLERVAASKKKAAPVVALRIPESDLALARKQAEQKGCLVLELNQDPPPRPKRLQPTKTPRFPTTTPLAPATP